jgi:hypothetical protein
MAVHADESQALARLYQIRGGGLSLEAFGALHSLGSGSMVWQYLNARRGLSLAAGLRFSRGLNAELGEFSPRLAKELIELLPHLAALPEDAARIPDSGEYLSVQCVELILEPSVRTFKTRPLLPKLSTIAFRKDWLKENGYRNDHLLAVECNDEGMQTTMFKGDLVVINTDDRTLVEGEAFALNDEGRLRLRRLFLEEGAWWMTADNKDPQRYPRKRLTKKHCFTLGRLVHRQSVRI